jgi:hypothetical protein
VPGGYNAHAAGLRAAMLTVFDAIKQSFHYYCITGLGSPFALSPKEFARFLMDAGVVDDDNPALTKKRCLAFFKVHSLTCKSKTILENCRYYLVRAITFQP